LFSQIMEMSTSGSVLSVIPGHWKFPTATS